MISYEEKKYVSAIAISADIIIKLFLFTTSFHNTSSIFYIDRGIVSTTLLKMVANSGCAVIQIVAIMTLDSLLSVL